MGHHLVNIITNFWVSCDIIDVHIQQGCRLVNKYPLLGKGLLDPQSGWFIMETSLEMDDLGVPPFQETYK